MADENVKCIMDNNGSFDSGLSSSLPTSSFFGKFFDTRRLSFTQKLLGPNGTTINNSKLSSSPKTPEGSFEETGQYFSRPRTQSVSSDVSLDEFQHPLDRRSSLSVSDRIIALQVERAENKFANYRSAITSYID